MLGWSRSQVKKDHEKKEVCCVMSNADKYFHAPQKKQKKKQWS
jgi:hypothetical protein